MPRAVWMTALAVVAGLAIIGGSLSLSDRVAEPPPASRPAVTAGPAAAAASLVQSQTPPGRPQPATTTQQTEPKQATRPARPPKPEEPLDLIPVDNLLCWKGLPLPDAHELSNQPSPLRTLIDLGTHLAGDSLDNKARLSLRILETLGIIGRYPFAVALIDARAKTAREDGGGGKVDQLRIAAVIQTDGQPEPFLSIIAKAVRELTDAGVATLQQHQVGSWRYQELRDSRLPEWCVVAWGEIDEHFVITFGQEVWPLVASVAAGKIDSVGRDEWVSLAHRHRPEEPLIEIIVACQDIRERLDPFVQGRATAFFQAWGIADVHRAHWALGFEGRALYCLADFRKANTTQRRVYADPRIRDERLLRTIPDEARYAVYRLPARVFLPRLISSYYATRDPEQRKIAARVWARIQENLGINAQRDALDNLGQFIIAHNYPKHPLRLPLAFTSLIEIRREPAKVRQTLETLMQAWQEAIDKAARDANAPNPIRICHEDDGVWFIQFPLFNGVAWTFTDKFIVISWSPDALRDYLDKVGDNIGRRE